VTALTARKAPAVWKKDLLDSIASGVGVAWSANEEEDGALEEEDGRKAEADVMVKEKAVKREIFIFIVFGGLERLF